MFLIVTAFKWCNTITGAADERLMCMQLAARYGSGIELAVFNSLSSTKTGALVRLDGLRMGGVAEGK